MKKLLQYPSRAVRKRAGLLFLVFFLFNAPLIHGQWVVESGYVLSVDDSYGTSMAASDLNSRVYAVASIYDETYPLYFYNVIRVNDNINFPFAFNAPLEKKGHRVELNFGFFNVPTIEIHDIYVHNGFLYISTDAGIGRISVTAPLPAAGSPLVITGLTNNVFPGKMIVIGSSPFAHIANGNSLTAVDLLNTNFTQNPQGWNLPATHLITDVVASSTHIFVTTFTNGFNGSNNRLISFAPLNSVGQVSGPWVTNYNIGSAIASSTTGRFQGKCLAIMNNQMLFLGTAYGLIRAPISSTLSTITFELAAGQISGNTGIFHDNVQFGNISAIATSGTNIYVSTPLGVAYHPNALLPFFTNAPYQRFNNGWSGVARTLQVASVGESALYALDANDFLTMRKSGAYGPGCSPYFTIAPSSPDPCLTRAFTATPACTTVSYNYTWFGTPGVSYASGNTGSTVNATFSAFNQSYRVRVHGTAENYGIDIRDSLLYTTTQPTPPSNQAVINNAEWAELNCTDPMTGIAEVYSQALSASWTRGNGNNVVVIARIGGEIPSVPSNAGLQVAPGTYPYGAVPVNNQSGLVGYIIYKGTGTFVNSQFDLSYNVPISFFKYLGNRPNISVAVFESEICGVINTNIGSNRRYPANFGPTSFPYPICPAILVPEEPRGTVNSNISTIKHQSSRTSIGIQLENLSREESIENVMIYDVHGRVLATAALLTPGELKELPLNGFRGMALIRFQHGGEIKSEKMIIE